jgi:hypothetical protein
MRELSHLSRTGMIVLVGHGSKAKMIFKTVEFPERSGILDRIH